VTFFLSSAAANVTENGDGPVVACGMYLQATDIYSFGLMMWELISSQRVFDDSVSIGQVSDCSTVNSGLPDSTTRTVPYC
jgi:hypothetical protein